MSKRAVVMSGGGAKGAFQVGVLTRLYEMGERFDVAFGTSVGALNAAGLAYLGPKRLQQNWEAITGKSDILSLNLFNFMFGTGAFSMKPLKKRLDSYIYGEPYMEAVACYVDLRNGKVLYQSNKDCDLETFKKAVLASSAIPGVMELPDDALADGGIREQSPLSQAIKSGADSITLILCNPMSPDPTEHWEPKFPKIVSATLRAIDVMEHEVFLNDIDECIEKNSDPAYKAIDLKVYAPTIVPIDTLDFDPKKIKQAIQMGREMLP